MMSKVYGREIVVRDRSRFYSFRDGLFLPRLLVSKSHSIKLKTGLLLYCYEHDFNFILVLPLCFEQQN